MSIQVPPLPFWALAASPVHTGIGRGEQGGGKESRSPQTEDLEASVWEMR